MKRDRSSLEGTWLVESSQCRCLPVRAVLELRTADKADAAMAVTWSDADEKAALTRRGGKVDADRVTFRFSTADGERHLLVASVHVAANGRRKLFGFVVSRNDREETGTGAWTANDVDPDAPPDEARPLYLD